MDILLLNPYPPDNVDPDMEAEKMLSCLSDSGP
jgi:hypothetical protein